MSIYSNFQKNEMTNQLHPYYQALIACLAPPTFPSSILTSKNLILVNVVYTVQLYEKPNVCGIADLNPNAKYNTADFASCNVKFANLGTILIFNTGKLVCVGASTINCGFYALQYARQMILKQNMPAEFHSGNVSNLVFSSEVGYWIDLAEFSADYQQHCLYEPKKFCGCTYTANLENGKDGCKVVLFEQMGRYNIMGIKSEDEAVLIARHLESVLPAYHTTPRTNRKQIPAQRELEKQESLAKRQKMQDTYVGGILSYTEYADDVERALAIADALSGELLLTDNEQTSLPHLW